MESIYAEMDQLYMLDVSMRNEYRNGNRVNNSLSCIFNGTCLGLLNNESYLDEVTGSMGELNPFEMPSWVYILMTLVYACIFIVGVLGNLLVIIVIAKDRRMRNTANFYLISLGIADLMIISFCLPVAAYELHAEEVWDLGGVLCKLAPLLQYLSTSASLSTMVAISIERFIVICRPFKVRTYCTKRRAFGVIVMLWTFSFFCSFPMLIFTRHHAAYHQKLKRSVHVCFIDYFESEAYFFFHQTCFYILPGLMLSFLYSKIIFTLRRFNSERFGISPDSRRNKGAGLAKSQAETNQLIAMLTTVVLCYFACLLPYNFITFLTLVSPDTLLDLGPTGYYILLDISRILFFVNSCSNPILYNAISGKFRAAFLRLFCPNRYPGSARDSRTASVRSGELTRLGERRSVGGTGGSGTSRVTWKRTQSTMERECAGRIEYNSRSGKRRSEECAVRKKSTEKSSRIESEPITRVYKRTVDRQCSEDATAERMKEPLF